MRLEHMTWKQAEAYFKDRDYRRSSPWAALKITAPTCAWAPIT